jgi:membrane protease YdiL (CAAX protease family)
MMFDLATFRARVLRAEPAPAWPLTTGLALLMAYFVARVVALALVSVVVDAGAAARGTLSALTVNLAGIVTGLVTLALVALILRRRAAAPAGAALRLGRWPGAVLVLVLFAIGMAILIDFVPLLFQRISLPVALRGMASAGLIEWLVAALHAVIVAPLAEMTLVQGVLYPALAARRGNVAAILVAALVYAVIQVFDSPADGVLWITALLSGLLFGGLRAHQQSTRVTVIAAAMFGLFALFKALRLFL